MTTIINLTPHTITVITPEGVREFPPSGQVARVEVFQNLGGELEGVPVYRSGFGDVVGLPEPEPDTYYIVSTLVAQALPYRTDLVAPNTAGAIRDESGRIIGVNGFQAFWY